MAGGALTRRSVLTGAAVAVAGGIAGFAVTRASSLLKTPTTPTAGPNGYGSPPSPATHLGCTVGTVQDGLIQCPCHGSELNAFTGAVVRGPAARPLPAVPVVVHAGEVYRDR